MKLKTRLIKQVFTLFMALSLPFIALSASDVTLKLNLSKGDQAKFSSSTEQVITQTVSGMQQVINQNQVYEYTIAVTEKKDNGNIMATITFDRVAMELKMQGMEMQFDSNDESDAPLANPQFIVFKAMVNQSVGAIISPLGEIVEVTDVDKLREKMTDGQAQLEQMVNSLVNEELVKQIFEGAFLAFPTKKLKTNDSWSESKSIENQFTLNTMSSYTVKAITNDEVNLSVSSTLATVPGNKSNLQGMEVTYNLFGTINGSIVVDKAKGFVTESVLEQNINGNIAGDMMGQKLDIPMSIVSKTTTKKIK